MGVMTWSLPRYVMSCSPASLLPAFSASLSFFAFALCCLAKRLWPAPHFEAHLMVMLVLTSHCASLGPLRRLQPQKACSKPVQS